MGTPDATLTMLIRDLVEDFITLCRYEQNQPAYERRYPALFDHYFRYWCPRRQIKPALTDKAIRARARRVTATIGPIESKLKEHRLDTDGIKVVLFVGGNTSNGHAFLDTDTWVIWLPVETYATDLRAQVFVTHELAHALHYQIAPDFYFHDENTKNHLGRQLITEGVATFLTAELLGVLDEEALWADYLTHTQCRKWFGECRRRDVELRALCRARFHESVADLGLFQANDPADIAHYRAGYLIGYAAVRNVCIKQSLDVQSLLALGRRRFEEFVLKELEWR